MTVFKNPIMPVGAEKMKRLTTDVEEIEKRRKCDGHLFQNEVLYHSIQIMMLDFFDIFARENEEERSVSFSHLEVMARFMGMLYDETYVQHRRLEYYADKLNVTTKYLSDVSRTFTGRGASYWINRFTTTRICLLLKSSSMSFSEIADKFCFSSPSHFYVYFQKQMGMSPSEYRKA